MTNPDPAPSAEQLRELPTPKLFREAFGAPAQRARLEQRQAEERQRQQLEDMNRRREALAQLRREARDRG